MQYGLTLPNIAMDARTLAELAHEAEDVGWDGFFVWDSVYSTYWDSVYRDDPDKRATCDPWIALAAIAMRTRRIRIGTMVTPVARRRPWKLARETVTLDHLSNGRLILSVGLGSLGDGAFSKVSEETNRKIRAQRLDEGLAVLMGLWSGQPFSYSGEHYRVQEMTFLPRPVQSPRIPIWVVGAWPRKTSMRRTLRWDGVIPAKLNADGLFADMLPADIQAMQTFIAEQRSHATPFDIVMEGSTAGNDWEKAVVTIHPYLEAGITWWLEGLWFDPGGVDAIRRRIKQGPPRPE